MDKNFINYHILISHSPSCLNRDDMNMQKSAVFGGKRRVRVSSQSLKRTIRKSPYYTKHLGEESIRSKHLNKLQEEFQAELGEEYSEDIIREALDRFVKSKAKEKNGTDVEESQTEETDESSEKKLAVAPWVKDEFKVICKVVREVREAGLTETEREKAIEKFKKQTGKKKKNENYFIEQAIAKKIDVGMQDNSDALAKAVGSAVDVALSGRMATSGLMTTIDGSLAVAHAMTTHVVDADIDWFTAVDDLQELGSGHLDTQEFSSGVFYRYASLNMKQLQVNLGLISDIQADETAESRNKALEIAAHVLHMFATEVPSAKQQSFAAHNLADMAMVSFSDIPVSLANAFEEPVKALSNGGFLKPSINEFRNYWEVVHKGYGLSERCGEFVLGEVDEKEGLDQVDSLELLKSWIKKDGAR